MLKRKFFAVALPLVASATIVGSGFAAWVFGAQTSSFEGPSIGVDITNSIDLTNVKLKVKSFTSNDQNGTDVTSASKFNIELDQGGHDETSASSITKGIRIKDNSNNTIDRFEIYVECSDDALVNMKLAGFEIKVNTTITFHTTLLNYVAVNEPTNWAQNSGTFTNTNPTNVYTTGEVNLDIPDTYDATKEEYFFDGCDSRMQILTGSTLVGTTSTTATNKYFENNKLLNWKTNQTDETDASLTKFTGKPKAKVQVEKMREDLKSVTDAIKIGFELSVTDPNSKISKKF